MLYYYLQIIWLRPCHVASKCTKCEYCQQYWCSSTPNWIKPLCWHIACIAHQSESPCPDVCMDSGGKQWKVSRRGSCTSNNDYLPSNMNTTHEMRFCHMSFVPSNRTNTRIELGLGFPFLTSETFLWNCQLTCNGSSCNVRHCLLSLTWYNCHSEACLNTYTRMSSQLGHVHVGSSGLKGPLSHVIVWAKSKLWWINPRFMHCCHKITSHNWSMIRVICPCYGK